TALSLQYLARQGSLCYIVPCAGGRTRQSDAPRSTGVLRDGADPADAVLRLRDDRGAGPDGHADDRGDPVSAAQPAPPGWPGQDRLARVDRWAATTVLRADGRGPPRPRRLPERVDEFSRRGRRNPSGGQEIMTAPHAD